MYAFCNLSQRHVPREYLKVVLARTPHSLRYTKLLLPRIDSFDLRARSQLAAFNIIPFRRNRFLLINSNTKKTCPRLIDAQTAHVTFNMLCDLPLPSSGWSHSFAEESMRAKSNLGGGLNLTANFNRVTVSNSCTEYFKWTDILIWNVC